ncbi:MAG: hypothetical protein HKO57_10230, partial [Akkermansiaceae bacterium]|nr:hypothetical protein [Akkermansiaceae bacterium]
YGPVDFGTADSNGAIGTPVLEFQATVQPGAPGFVENFATVSDSTGRIQPTNSKRVVTRLPVGTIGNVVWLDENGDGIQDAGEPGIAGVTVELLDGSGNPIDSDPVAAGVQPTVTTTDADGGYLFASRAPVTYTVKVEASSLPAGLVLTGDPDATADGEHPVTIADGDEYLAADFGYNWVPAGDSSAPASGATGAIGDRVWNDADGDGLQDPGESGIGGVTVSLLTDDNGDGIYGGTGDNAAATTTTAPDGSYIFDGLSAGGYVVKVTAPAGYTQTGDPDGTVDGKTTVPIVLAPGDVFVNADFGYDLAGGGVTVGDTIYLDANGNGSFDSTVDAGLAGVTVALEDAAGAVIATTSTGADGNYAFPGLPTGADYTVVVTDTDHVLGGLVPRGDPDGGTPGQSTLAALSADDLAQDFGYAPPGHDPGAGLLGDTIFIDTDNNGALTAGEGVEGVAVDLYDAAGSTLLASTTTNENGRYFFGDLDPTATYTVKVDTTGILDGLLNFADPDAGTANESVTNLAASGGIDLGQDFGYTGFNTVNGTIWTDTNADGTRQAGETGRFAGVTVDLRDGDGNVIATTSTAADGTYSFEGLPDGTFTVDVTDRANVLDGHWHTLGTDSASDPAPVSVSGASPTATADFGYYRDLARIGDFVFNDANNNGIQDAGELGIGGVPVTLTIDYPNGAQVVLTTLSASDGSYNFENLLADESFAASGGAGEPVYTVTAATPAGLVASPPNLGGDDTVDSDNGITGETASIVQGGSDPTNDFGFNPVSYIEDFVFEDLNANGIQDDGEVGLEGVTVNLLNVNGDQVATTTTGANGDYSFVVAAGTYQLEFEAPGDWVFSPADQGGDDTLDSDPDPADGKTAQVSVAPGETNDTIDAGIYDPKSQVYVKYVALFGLSGADAQAVPDGTGTGGNPDGDNASNLVEYALCNDPNSGLVSHQGFCVELADPASGRIDATFTRPEGVVDVIYTLQGSNDLLGAWTDIASIAAGDAAASPFTVASNGDGSETVTLGDVSSTTVGGIAGLTA